MQLFHWQDFSQFNLKMKHMYNCSPLTVLLYCLYMVLFSLDSSAASTSVINTLRICCTSDNAAYKKKETNKKMKMSVEHDNHDVPPLGESHGCHWGQLFWSMEFVTHLLPLFMFVDSEVKCKWRSGKEKVNILFMFLLFFLLYLFIQKLPLRYNLCSKKMWPYKHIKI